MSFNQYINDNDEDMPPAEVVEHVMSQLLESWQSQGGLSIDSRACGDHFHICVFPAVRELVGGKEDGKQVFADFVVDVNKLSRCFDHKPRLFFDTSSRGGIPFIIAYGKIKGVKCDISVIPCPPPNVQPMEVAYVEGPKAGTVEPIKPRPKDDE